MNYRATHPEQVSLREILSGSLDPQLSGLIRDRIILIGLVNPTVDRHRTPYQPGLQGQTVPGVLVQSHMISQIVGAALGERSLLSWWPQWVEMVWLLGWCGVGGSLDAALSGGCGGESDSDSD